MIEKLLELRKRIKKKKPEFIRQDNQIKSLKRKWKQPKGIHSKLREKRKGHIGHPAPCYASPKYVKFLHPSGLKEVVVSNPGQLAQIKNDEGIVLSAVLGLRKKLILLKKIRELKLPVLNIKNIDEFISSSESAINKRKQEKHQNLNKKEESRKELEKKSKEQKEKKQETPEEKDNRIKEEKRKILEAKK